MVDEPFNPWWDYEPLRKIYGFLFGEEAAEADKEQREADEEHKIDERDVCNKPDGGKKGKKFMDDLKDRLRIRITVNKGDMDETQNAQQMW